MIFPFVVGAEAEECRRMTDLDCQVEVTFGDATTRVGIPSSPNKVGIKPDNPIWAGIPTRGYPGTGFTSAFPAGVSISVPFWLPRRKNCFKGFLTLFPPNSGRVAARDTPKVKAFSGMLAQHNKVVDVRPYCLCTCAFSASAGRIHSWCWFGDPGTRCFGAGTGVQLVEAFLGCTRSTARI
eukprot:2076894-Rhodomonas_salina.1